MPLNIASAIAIATYYNGYSSLQGLFKMIGLSVGRNTVTVLKKQDHSRLYLAKRSVDAKQKKIRQANRKRRLEMHDDNHEEEGNVYEAGRF